MGDFVYFNQNFIGHLLNKKLLCTKQYLVIFVSKKELPTLSSIKMVRLYYNQVRISAIAAVREPTFNFSYKLVIWVLTVLIEIKSSFAIC